MNQYLHLVPEIKEIVEEKNVFIDEPMRKHTYFKIGGPADILVLPETIEQVIGLLKLCISKKVPHHIIGNGSNLLVKDGGIRGVVIKLCSLNQIEVEEDKITAMCGVLLSDVSKSALQNSLTGFEFACGIPGTIGGAVTMNAGAYGGEMVDVIETALVLDEQCNLKILTNEELELGYRTSAVMKYNYIVLKVTLKLKQGEYEEINGRIKELTAKREEKQPLEYPSAGSTFKRPVGFFAGKLIQDSGLKGKSLGGAAVSEKHSGFIINKNNASAKDILDLINLVQNTVKEKFGVELHTEIRIIGDDIAG
ncbi:UDP-N-acetylmuramate dehydrogenase [Desnuesiella massiliensis]|uniref:UDP-N-acetylmuramate dehydrogenase n=1 Tax=Desnuesiella massiliensis TaxID=1650662 RepID=UPI0006E136AF|nr:UDP-N-acetylmuramate dehydrogenase [Desnuesiella massiliensis]